MRYTLVVAGALAAAVLMVTSGARASTGSISLKCDRACLEGVLDQYLAALVAHDPKRLPLSVDAKYTENDQLIDIGDGFWKTVEGMGNYKHVFVDPGAGQVVFMGTMHEAGAPLLMSLRLRIELGRITEIESVYFKPGGAGPNNIPEMDKPGYKPEDMWFKTIPPAERLSRQEMIAIADAYFSGLEKNDGKGVNGTGTYPFTNDCDRIENGSHTTNVPRPPNEPKDAINGFALDCMSQFKLGYYFVVQAIHHRRYPLVDAERGVVWSHAVFDQGTVNSGVLSDGRPYTFRGFNRPSSILVNEAFLIENGKIRRVEMIGPGSTYHLNSAWPGGLSGK
ncbi:MAG TPA: hypothetical protein VK708_14380 [Bryobacteraceae bacterium]|nr:hypothetical protein [Bryobacteraceae bacterium]